MTAEILNGNISHGLSDDVKTIVEDIARELNFKDFEIIVKNQDFTGDNYLGDISRIKLTPAEQDGQKPINLVVKRAPASAASREGVPVNTYYKREIFTYTNIFPVINKLQEAQCIPIEERISFAKYFNGISEELKEMMVMKDLADDGLTLHEKSIPFDYEHASIILQNLARLHACSFVLKEKEPEVFARLTDNIAQSLNYGKCLIDMQEKLILKIIPMIECPKNKKKLESFVQKVEEIEGHCLDAKSYEPYNVICHGDCWNNNMLFKYEEKVQLGELMLSLCYLPTAGRLTLTIIKGRNLKAMDITGSSDPYVKVYLICQGKRIKKKKTTVKKNTLCPVYNEALVFDVPAENVEEVSLLVKVIDYDRIGSNELMGCTAIGSSYIGVGRDHWLEMLDNPRKPVAQWYPLAESVSGDLPTNGSDHPVSLSCLNGR